MQVKRRSPRRSDCPIACALDFVGDKWTLVVLRDLIFARKRHFQEFLDSPEKIASNILAARLKLLEKSGLVTRAADPSHGRRVVYAPTTKALDLLPIMIELMRWGARYDAKSAAPARFMRRIAEDRDAFVAEIRAQHKLPA
jgi:DNA-binding HxlR family transcriptional regulator